MGPLFARAKNVKNMRKWSKIIPAWQKILTPCIAAKQAKTNIAASVPQNEAWGLERGVTLDILTNMSSFVMENGKMRK